MKNCRLRGKLQLSYPVDDEDLTDTELVLELLGSYCYRIEVAETPEKPKKVTFLVVFLSHTHTHTHTHARTHTLTLDLKDLHDALVAGPRRSHSVEKQKR